MHPKTTTVMRICLTTAAGLLIAGCASHKPVATVAMADLALDHALRSKAPQYASAELQSARTKLAEAREAMAEGNDGEARRLAEDALAGAELAEAKAQSRAAEDEVREQIEALRDEARRLGVGAVTTETTVVRREGRPTIFVVP